MDPSRRFQVVHYVQPCAVCKAPLSIPEHLRRAFAQMAVVCSDACYERYPGALIVVIGSPYRQT